MQSDVSDLLVTPGFEFSASGMKVIGDPTYQQWRDTGEGLLRIERVVKWWIGDWLQYGERRWGEMYSQAMDATGLAYETCRNAKWVSESIPPERRRPELSFEHHKTVAALSPGEQDTWLDKATADHLTVVELRHAIREDRNHTENVIPEVEAVISEIRIFRGRVDGIVSTLAENNLSPADFRRLSREVEGLLEDVGKILEVLYERTENE
jgi:hypothetical protein